MSNKHLHLLDRIKNLNVSLIENMSPDVMAMMTDRFDESLVRNVLYVGKTNSEQRKIIRCVKNNYKSWRGSTDALRIWGKLPSLEVYPNFLLEMQMDIECGMVVTETATITQEKSNAIFGDSEPPQLNPQSDDILRKENEELKAQVESMRAQIADYAAKYDPQDLKKKKFAAMTGKQHVILYLAILANAERLPNARKNLSWELSFIAARNQSTMEDYLKSRITQDECNTLAANFPETPFIANIIKELPDKLKQDVSEKNRNKVLKKDKQ